MKLIELPVVFENQSGQPVQPQTFVPEQIVRVFPAPGMRCRVVTVVDLDPLHATLVDLPYLDVVEELRKA